MEVVFYSQTEHLYCMLLCNPGTTEGGERDQERERAHRKAAGDGACMNT